MNTDKIKNKSVGASKKTKKREVSPIITLMAVLISKKFLEVPCPNTVIENFNFHVIAYLKNKTLNDSDAAAMIAQSIVSGNNLEDDLLAPLKHLKDEDGTKLEELCKKAYSNIGKKTKICDGRAAILSPMVNVDQTIDYLISKLPVDYVEAMFDYPSLSDIFGVYVAKRVDEVWQFVEEKGIRLSRDLSSKYKKKRI